MNGTTGRMTAVAMLAALTGCGSGGAGGGDVTGTNITTGVPEAAKPETATDAPLAAAALPQAAGQREPFLGTWTGPEGLSFVVEATPYGGGYRIRNRDTLDSAQTFDGTSVDGTLRFVRRGQALSARPGTGAETGYKWLAQKQDCLVVKAGVEGYCRD